MKLVKQLIACVVASMAASTATATLDDQMRKSFDGLVNITPSGQYEGQTRGVITGGNLYVRNKITNTQLVRFQAPSIKAGCGGIDIYKGSLGFISKVEFEALLQSIASAARGYAFQLALDIVCPTCAANMKELQDKIQKLTGGAINSCEIAKFGVNKFTPLKDMADASVAQSGRQASSMWGIFDNFFESSVFNKVGGEPRDPRAHLSASQKNEAGVTGNVVWQALNQSTVAMWYGYGATDTEFMELMMDVAGTIVVNNTNDGAEKTITTVTTHPGRISMKEFLHGSTSTTQKLNCDTTLPEGCLNPTPAPFTFEGMLPKIERMMNGGGGSTGILAKLRDKVNVPSTFTPEEQLFIIAASPGILGLLRDFAYDTRSARAVSDIFKQTLAQEMTISFITEMMDNITAALVNVNNTNGIKEKAEEVVERSRQHIRDAREDGAMTLQGVSQAFLVASYMRQNLKSRIDAEKDPLIVK